jgi:phospholipase C
MIGIPHASGQTYGDITFFVGSDLHYGYTDGTNSSTEVSRATLDSMNALPGQAYPDGAGGSIVDNPRGVLLIGDLTEDGASLEWAAFTRDWGLNGERRLRWPVYEGFGNHDCYGSEVVPTGIKARNPVRPGVANISTNGYHYSWDWDYLHLVCLNLFPAETPDLNGVSPRDSLAFLAEDLAQYVGNSGRPVVIYHHYGFDGWSGSWWSDQQRSAYLAVITNYNVIAVFAGHNHLVDYIPVGGVNTFSDGTVGKVLGPEYVINFLAVHVTQTNLVAAERRADGTWGSVFSLPITVNLQPYIVSNPPSATAWCGSSTRLVVKAVGPDLSYQWFLDRTNAVGSATNSVLTLSNLSLSQSGVYSVLVTNSYGAAFSLPVTLTVSAPPGSSSASGTIQDVQHVVILMQENRSFDHYFGSLKGVRGFNDPNALVFPNGNTDFYQSPGSGYVLPFPVTAQCLNHQDDTRTGDLVGCDVGRWDQWVAAKGPAAMAYYTRADLSFYYALADAYTVCDEYHCSVLGPAYPNRLYLMTGTIDPQGAAGGPVTDNSLSQPYTWTTYPERLQAAGVTWKVYQQASDNYNLNPLRWFAQFADTMPGNPLYDRGLSQVDDLLASFQSDVTNGTLPQVSWIIPPWSRSEHPPFPPADGQLLTKQLLDSLALNPAVYSSTVFILTYDEDGGFFDHVPAPMPPSGTADEFVNGLPIGLGVRVPTILVSPWTRGGYVCSQIFDHTSVIRFLEQWTGVQEPNISDWRRQVCGDLTSAFDFSWPELTYPFLPAPAAANCDGIVAPVPPFQQMVPLQEPGTKPSRARPYRSNAFSFADCTNQLLGITMTNAGTASAHFAIYANAFRPDGPWQYDVPASGSVTDYFSVSATAGRYDFTCYGPHRFHQRFAGSINADCSLLNVQASPDPDGSGFILSMANASTAPVTFTVTNAAHPGVGFSYTVLPGNLVTNRFGGAYNGDGTYSFAAAASTDPTFLRQFEGDTDTTALQFMTNTLPVLTNPPPVVTNAPPIVTNVPPVLPVLSIFLARGTITLSFPAWAASYTLRSSTNLAPDSWTAVNTVPVTNADKVILTLPLTASPIYYRMLP